MKREKLSAGIFIDDSNLFYAQKKVGWKIDIKKLKGLLEEEVKVEFINYFMAVPAIWDNTYKACIEYKKKISKIVNFKTKNLKYIRTGNAIIKKGDVDMEVALEVARTLHDLDLVIIVSGDSDYVELRKYVIEHGKKIVFMSFRENMAWEIKKGKYILLNELREYIELSPKKTPRDKPGRLLLDILYQKKVGKSR